jgi:hypothetical protein
MVGDLLDFTRTRLGRGIPVVRQELDLGKLLREAVEEISAAHPHHRFQLDTPEEQSGEWDGARLSQALTNLIAKGGACPPGDQCRCPRACRPRPATGARSRLESPGRALQSGE